LVLRYHQRINPLGKEVVRVSGPYAVHSRVSDTQYRLVEIDGTILEDQVHGRWLGPYVKPTSGVVPYIKSVYELIIILNDVVKALGALAGCNILHRDISDSNIMFTRDKYGNVCGVLIDLDNAVDAERAQIDKRPICTGTLPFMSVNNLEQSDAVRKMVDELESMLYLLIWMG
ncbi:hypothetical protein LPJ61_006511, partial [Coemansia biformis]